MSPAAPNPIPVLRSVVLNVLVVDDTPHFEQIPGSCSELHSSCSYLGQVVYSLLILMFSRNVINIPFLSAVTEIGVAALSPPIFARRLF
ncbi:hypothetical protein CY34DRAFT_709627 [Suillus luteus UH-Slu-Lm8-n1]|uniref:Uncharacterized protein n=1 Tax=Suillus luteus UH-Slu-Lm8-n1 TaxID=930992 RepID=A0A0D0BJN7_9AGAM|nr:hypothetical protein CY34DRAFT_709627 [Suillus luteus UH-Slu-Lm8-n1]